LTTVRFSSRPEMEPLGSERSIYSYPIAGKPLYHHMLERWLDLNSNLRIAVDDPLILTDQNIMADIVRFGDVVTTLAMNEDDGTHEPLFLKRDGASLELRYPWHLLNVLDEIADEFEEYIAPDADIEDGVEFGGKVIIESGVKIMSRARLKGNIYLGAGTIIGNSAMLRGNVSMGPNSVVGLSGEVKNSLMLERSLVGPMTTMHESICEEDCFIGGTTRVSNYRLDNRNVDVLVNGESIDTGRLQFGTILAAGVRFGGACLILPGRKIGRECEIGPHVVVTKNLPARKRIILRQNLAISDL
jgi:UDP-N-acetylglucosamine diphosphorylase / glucose-1-phosphate thymidylyltransferase / UDP-N-acetylgalactosamine diphosphorylase / glucosamine-1-phosphate N-acetyltransferase / galactosamine-1-phosphate N-acetyltransferase